MRAWFWKLLTPATFADEERAWAALMLHRILLVGVLIFLAAVPVLGFMSESASRIPFLLILILLNFACLYLLHHHHLSAACWLFISGGWLVVTIACFTGAGIYTPSFAGYIPLIIFAAIILGERAALMTMVASIGCGLLLIVFQEQIPQRIYAPSHVLVIQILVMMIATTLIYFTARRVRSMLARAHRGEQALLERNHQLEQQIAGRQQAESERDRFFDMSIDMLAIATLDGYFKRINLAFERTLGYTPAELCAAPFHTFIHPDDVERTLGEVRNLADGEGSDVFENRYRCKNGDYRWFSWTTRHADGLLYAVARDVTDMKAAEQALRASESRYRLLFENVGLPTVIYDPTGTILMINQHAARDFGVPPEKLIGRSLHDLFSPDVTRMYLERIERTVMSGLGDITEDRISLPDREIWYLTNTQCLYDEHGQPFAVQVLAHDITTIKEAEKRQLELSLAKERATFLTDFLNSMSHDLKTPLTVITTSLYLLEKVKDPQMQHDKIQRIKEQTKLVEKYIQDILTVSRLEYLPNLSLHPIRINDQLTDILRQLRPKVERKQLHIQMNLSADFPPVNADYDQLYRAFINLVENAINYTPNGGAVIVTTIAMDAALNVEIADTGIGITSDDLPNIFDPFYRSQVARQVVDGGTGLGLAIVRKILDVHGFGIEVVSAPGQGTTFRIAIPRSAITLEEEVLLGS